jgi:hypothetical protein
VHPALTGEHWTAKEAELIPGHRWRSIEKLRPGGVARKGDANDYVYGLCNLGHAVGTGFQMEGTRRQKWS